MNRFIVSVLWALLIGGLCCHPASAAVEKTFGTGSLIIPMDGSTYQSDDDGGIYVSYGLVYQLLDRRGADGVSPDPIPVYMIIDDQKVAMTATDLTISASTDPVAKEHKASGEIAISGVGTSISYSGGPFVIESVHAAAAKTIWANGFQNVNLHVAKVPFTGKVQREMAGRPPKFALMNSKESRTAGAVTILQDYLQAAGIVNDPTKCNPDNAPVSGPDCVFDVLTPNEVAGLQTLSGTPLGGKSLLFDYTCPGCDTQPRPNYNLVWAPHWVAGTGVIPGALTPYKSFNPLVGTMPANSTYGDNAIMAVRDFVSTGNGLFAECAGIESFEDSPYGRFLTKFDLGYNGGSNDKIYVYYNKDALADPFGQLGDFGQSQNGFDPQGGHLHNWRPFQVGDKSTHTPPLPMAFDPSPDNLKSTYTQANTGYDSTVAVMTYDDPPAPPAGTSPAPDIHDYQDGDGAIDQWHYYIKGSMDEDQANGTVVYLGGHSYVKCGDGTSTSALADHEMKFTFSQDMSVNTSLSLIVAFTVGVTGSTMTIAGITPADLTTHTTTSGDLTVDFSGAALAGSDLTGIHFVNENLNEQLTVDSVEFGWTPVAGAVLNDVYDVTEDFNVEQDSSNTYAKNETVALAGLTLDAAGFISGCAPKGDSGAGMRYVLNAMFRLNTVPQTQFIRSSPVVYNDFLYQGSFDHPSYSGHFRKFQTNADLGSGVKGLKLVAGFGTSGDAATELTSDTTFTDANSNSSVDVGELSGRNIYASTEAGLESGTVLKDNTKLQPFTFANANLFQTRMSVLSALTLSQTEVVISKRYGMEYTAAQGWSKRLNVMGGIEHSAPAIVGPSTLTSTTRPTVAYVGGLDGMIHAFKAGTNHAVSPNDPGEIAGAGDELWSFVPSSQLPRLQYFRDPNQISSYPAVDSSLAYLEVPTDPADPKGAHMTVLLATMGVGGNSLVALDVTDPTATNPAKPEILWERSGVDAGSGTVTMGNGSKVAMGRVTNLAAQPEYRAFVTTALKEKKPCQDNSGVPLGDGSLCGGIQVYALDLYTGAQKWRFERVYTSGVNDLPGSLALVDVDQNGYQDYVVLGDMEGNLWLLPTVPDYDQDTSEDTVIKADSTFDTGPAWSGGIITDIPPLYAPTRDEPVCSGGETPLTSPTPCYEAGQDQPIGISATVVTRGGRTFLAWTTGGSQWAGDSYYYALFVLEITGVNVYQLLDANGEPKGSDLTYKFVLDQGEKTFGAVTYSEGYYYFGTAFGQVDGNPTDTLDGQNGNIRSVSSTDKSQNWKYVATGKFRGSVFVSKGELYATTIDGRIIDIGSGAFSEPSALEWFNVKSWRQIFDLGTNQ